MGDFVMEHGKVANEVVRIDYILVHNWDGVRRLFVKGTRFTTESLSTCQDPILGSGYRRLCLPHPVTTPPALFNDSTALIGLPFILPRQLYIIPITVTAREEITVTDRVSAEEFLWVERSLLRWL